MNRNIQKEKFLQGTERIILKYKIQQIKPRKRQKYNMSEEESLEKKESNSKARNFSGQNKEGKKHNVIAIDQDCNR